LKENILIHYLAPPKSSKEVETLLFNINFFKKENEKKYEQERDTDTMLCSYLYNLQEIITDYGSRGNYVRHKEDKCHASHSEYSAEEKEILLAINKLKTICTLAYYERPSLQEVNNLIDLIIIFVEAILAELKFKEEKRREFKAKNQEKHIS